MNQRIGLNGGDNRAGKAMTPRRSSRARPGRRTGSDNRAGEAMTLASIAYCTNIEAALGKNAPGWSLVWQPDAPVNGTLAYIAYNKQEDQYALAIRGSIIDFSWGSFDNWFEQDLNVLLQSDWPYPQMNGVKISLGSAYGLSDLNALSRRDGCLLTRIVDVFRRVPNGPQSILVTGHSLGGNLATVCAPWLHYQLKQAGVPPPPHFPVMTFAAPTAGNVAFASMYDAMFPDSWRYYNTLDIIPRASVPETIRSIGTLYTPSPKASDVYITYKGTNYTLPEAFDEIAKLIHGTEWAYNSYYSQTNLGRGSVPLTPGAKDCAPNDKNPVAEQWISKAGCEHGHETYLSLLGAKQLKDCTPTAPAP